MKRGLILGLALPLASFAQQPAPVTALPEKTLAQQVAEQVKEKAPSEAVGLPAALKPESSSRTALDLAQDAAFLPHSEPVEAPGIDRAPAGAADHPPRIAKSAKTKGRRKKHRTLIGAKKRRPASVGSEPDTQVFDEHTSFESYVQQKGNNSSRDPASFAPQARVIAVKRELGLTTTEADSAPQDIILNTGTEGGLDEGMVLSVARSIPVLDPYRENQQKQLEVELGRIKIIHAQVGLAVARVEKIEPIKTGLAVGTRAVLIGDYVGKFTK